MSAYEVTDAVVEAASSADKYDVIILNYANCDMVGHTGVFDAAKAPSRPSTPASARVVDAIWRDGRRAAHHRRPRQRRQDGTSDDGSPFTAHTTNPVPFCVVGYPCKLREGGRLADIAPTMLKILGLPQPEEMTGKSIIL